MPIESPGDRKIDKRRSRRVQITMPVAVRWKRAAESMEERGLTVAVSAHGCMLHVAAKLERGEQVTIVNIATSEQQLCTVTFLGPTDSGKAETGLEFLEPCPQFWRMHFPPDDWDPADRKLPGSSLPLIGRRNA
jgi:hypothetical protein